MLSTFLNQCTFCESMLTLITKAKIPIAMVYNYRIISYSIIADCYYNELGRAEMTTDSTVHDLSSVISHMSIK